MAGPGSNPQGGNRMRNTFANILSKNQVNYQNPGGQSALPSLDPAAEAAYYNQLAGLYAGYQTQLQGLKQQRVGIRADARMARTEVRAQKLADLAGTENAAIERGMLGGTADLQARAGVEATAAAGQAAISNQKLQGLAQNRIAAQQAGTEYFMGAAALEADKVAQQQMVLAQQLERNLIVSGQEAQLDALKGIYNALSNGLTTPGSGGGGAGRRAPAFGSMAAITQRTGLTRRQVRQLAYGPAGSAANAQERYESGIPGLGR